MKISFVSLILISLLFSFHSSHAQFILEEEETEDPYLPNAYDNKLTTPAYNYSNNTSRIMAGSTIVTRQVNINSSGQNIVGDAANEPNIAINPVNPDNIVIGWRQFDNVGSANRKAGYAYSTDRGQQWFYPGVIVTTGQRSDPVLEFDNNGNAFYYSLTTGFACIMNKSTDGGVTWGTAVSAGGGDKNWMTIDRTSGVGSGNIYASWSPQLVSTCLPGFMTRSTDANTTWDTCRIESTYSYFKTMTVGNSGELYIAGCDTVSFNTAFAQSVNAQTPGSSITWNPRQVIDLDGKYLIGPAVNPVGLLGQANIDVDRSTGPGRDNIYILASLSRLAIIGDPGDVMFVKSTDGGATWSTGKKINDDNTNSNTQWLGTMSVAPNGRIDAVWLDTRNASAGDSSALYYSFSVDQGNTWSANEKMSNTFNPHLGYPNQSKMGDYLDMISDLNGAHVAWAGTFNGEQDIYYSYITPYTNVNIDEYYDATVNVFPNPTNGKITITNTIRSQLELYNALGEKLNTITGANGKTELDLSSQSSGIYFLKATSESGSTKMKSIVKD